MIAVVGGAGAALLAAAALLLLLVLRRRILVVSVTGLSMVPTLRSGDRILVRRIPAHRVCRGDVVVLRDPGFCWRGESAGPSRRWVVKRVVALPGDPAPGFLPTWSRPAGVVASGTLVVLGDNPEMSRDSRHIGAVPAERVLGVAVRRLGGEPLAPGGHR